MGAGILVGGFFVAAALFMRKGSDMILGRAVELGQEAAFINAIPKEAGPYALAVLAAAKLEAVDPFTVVAIGMRESRFGAACVPPGPGGKGDAGHGHGIMQIDDRSFADWLAANNWKDPLTNIRKGVQILKAKRAFFTGRSKVAGLTDGKLVALSKDASAKRGVNAGNYPDPRPISSTQILARAAIAAYNTGEGNVLRSLAAGVDPDVTTAHGNYAKDVLSRIATMTAAFDKLVPPKVA